MRRVFLVACLSFPLLSACYESFPSGETGPGIGLDAGMVDGGGGLTCGDTVCIAGQRCCEACEGTVTQCIPEGLSCPDVDCPDLCDGSDDCGANEVCLRPVGQCGAPGQCAPRPEVCDDDCPGVCGCDGRTYCNECVAAADGVSLEEDVACPLPCGRGGEICAETEFCATSEECGADDLFACVPRPADCPDPTGPEVCGCNGVVFESECLANRAGISVSGDPDRCGLGGSTREELCEVFCEDAVDRCDEVFEIPGNCEVFCLELSTPCEDDELEPVAACLEIDDCLGLAICLTGTCLFAP